MTRDVRVFTYETRMASDPLTEEVLCAFGKLYGEMERSLFKELTSKTPHHINEIKSHFLNCFGVTARQFNGCLKLLQGKIESVKETTLLRIFEIKERIARLKQKIPRIKKADVRHEKKRSLQKTIDILRKLEKDQKEGVISLCFGGKKLFNAQFHLKENGYESFDEWKEDWQEARSSEFYCIGSKDETAGNQTCVLTLSPEGEGSLHLRLPDALMEQFGKHLVIPITFPAHGRQGIYKALKSHQALSYRFKKDKKGWRVFVTFEQERAPTITKNHIGSIGIDINVNHIALVETDLHGNPIAKKSYPLCTYGKNQTQAKALIGDTVKKIVDFAKEKQKPIIREELEFTKKKANLREDSKKRARMLSSFHYSSFIENLESKAFREGVPVHAVNPAMTSIIGKIKFAARYGLTVHHGAALVIARRHSQFSEEPSQCPMKVVHKQFRVTCPVPERNPGEHLWSLWRRINKKLKAALAALSRTSPTAKAQACASG